METFDTKAYIKSRSKNSRLIFKADNIKVFEHHKENSSKISLILVDTENGDARFISGSELANRVAAFTRGMSYSTNDILKGYTPPVGGIVRQ